MTRFVCRNPDGSEEEIPDLEELGRRIRSGEIGAETELYDASTDQWSRAGELPVFHFLQEESSEEVPRLTDGPSERGSAAESDIGTADGEVAAEGDAGGSDPADASSEAGAAVDPLGVPDLPEPAPPPDLPEPAAPPEPGSAPTADAEEPPEPVVDPSGTEDLGRREPFLDPLDFGRAEPEDAGDEAPSEIPVGDDGSGQAGAEAVREGSSTAGDPWWVAQEEQSHDPLPPSAVPNESVQPAPKERPATPRAAAQARRSGRASRRAARKRTVRASLLVGGVAMAGMALTAYLLVSPDGRSEVAEASHQTASRASPTTVGNQEGGDGTNPGVLPEAEGLPSHLQEEEQALRTLVAAQLADRVEEFREAHDLRDDPPQGWLTGRYFASAGEFEGIRAYWSRYRDFLGDVEARDRALFAEALEEGLAASELPSEDREVMGARLREAFEGAEEERQERYGELRELSEAVLDLHDLLEANAENIAYTPAFGETVVGDPVLEAVPGDPELRQDINAHLDRTFEALDRSHGVEPVSTDELMEAMFERLWGG